MTESGDWSCGRGVGEEKIAGNNQINVRVLKTLLVSKIRLCVVFLKLFIPLQHKIFDTHICLVKS